MKYQDMDLWNDVKLTKKGAEGFQINLYEYWIVHNEKKCKDKNFNLNNNCELRFRLFTFQKQTALEMYEKAVEYCKMQPISSNYFRVILEKKPVNYILKSEIIKGEKE